MRLNKSNYAQSAILRKTGIRICTCLGPCFLGQVGLFLEFRIQHRSELSEETEVSVFLFELLS